MTDGTTLLEKALYDGKAIETAPVACTDPECGYVYTWMLDPETESWDDVSDYIECGRKERDIPGTSDPIAPEHPHRVHDPCEAPAKVFKDETVLQQDDRTPEEIANDIYEREQRGPQP
jgi:hypothetical protein